VGGLLVLMSRVALMNAAALISLLEEAPLPQEPSSPSSSGAQPALAVVMPIWLERVTDVAGEYPSKQVGRGGGEVADVAGVCPKQVGWGGRQDAAAGGKGEPPTYPPPHPPTHPLRAFVRGMRAVAPRARALQAIAALLRLLEHKQLPSLAGLSVKGEPLASTARTTRSQAKLQVSSSPPAARQPAGRGSG